MKLYFAYRVLLLCVMLVLTSVALFAQTTWTTNGVYSAPHSATATLGMVTPGYFPLSLRYTFEAPRIFASLGFQVKNEVEDYNHEDIALNAIYFLRLPERFRIGFGGTYHVNWMNETDEDKHITHLISTTQDIQLGVYATVSFWRMYANVNALWFGTMQTLESLPGRILFQSDSAVSVYLGGHVADNFTAEIGVSSYQFYKYDLHIAPYFSFALRYEFLTEYFAEKPLAGHLFAEFSQTAHYTDFFTLSGLLKNASSTFTVGYNWGRAKK